MERLQAKSNITFEQFMDIFVRLAKKVRPDILVVERYPNELTPKVITYTVTDKSPFTEQKPRIRQSIPDPENSGYVLTFWAQRFNYTVRFDCYSKTNTETTELVNWLEDFMFTYTGAFKESGLSEIMYNNRLGDSSTEVAGEHLEVKSISFTIRVEKIYTISTKYLEEVRILMQVKTFTEYDGYFTGGQWLDYFDVLDTNRWEFLGIVGSNIIAESSKLNIMVPATTIGKNMLGAVTKQSFLNKDRNNTWEVLFALTSLNNAIFYIAVGSNIVPENTATKMFGIRIFENSLESFFNEKVIMQKNENLVDTFFKKVKINLNNNKLSFSIDNGSGYSFFGEVTAEWVDLAETAKLFIGVVSNSASNQINLSIDEVRVVVKESSQETKVDLAMPVNVVSINDYDWLKKLV